MTAVAEPPPRIATLDIVRGVAVMGILTMNITDFAMPPQAYMNPAAYGFDGFADKLAWAGNFIVFDGKMRGLFSLLFGASVLLVIDRAAASGQPARSIHFRRMLWLALFGLLHFYLIWHGDILFGYALCGMALWFFRNLAPRTLVRVAIGFILVQFLLLAAMSAGLFMLAAAAAAPGAPPEAVQAWAGKQAMMGIPSPADLQAALALGRGSYEAILAHRVGEQAVEPLVGLIMFGWETIGYMLLGMAALRTGFLTGAWSDSAYRKTALVCFAIAVPVYALYAWILIRDGFTIPVLMTVWGPATVPVRPVMIFGVAALVILATRSGGPLVGRIAAAGRAAFTNYLGTSIVMTTLFFGYGGGLFGYLGRAELWLVVVAMWALMLLWSKPWLERFRYGPFEWAWRSLARWSPQPMRGPAILPAPSPVGRGPG